MRPFNLEEAKAGASVCISVASEAFSGTLLARAIQNRAPFHFIGLCKDGDAMIEGGVFSPGGTDNHCVWRVPVDKLAMAPAKQERWLNLYRTVLGIRPGRHLYGTEEEARKQGETSVRPFFKPVRVEFED